MLKTLIPMLKSRLFSRKPSGHNADSPLLTFRDEFSVRRNSWPFAAFTCPKKNFKFSSKINNDTIKLGTYVFIQIHRFLKRKSTFYVFFSRKLSKQNANFFLLNFRDQFSVKNNKLPFAYYKCPKKNFNFLSKIRISTSNLVAYVYAEISPRGPFYVTRVGRHMKSRHFSQKSTDQNFPPPALLFRGGEKFKIDGLPVVVSIFRINKLKFTPTFTACTAPPPTHVLCVYNLRELSEKFWRENSFIYLMLISNWANPYMFLCKIVPKIHRCHPNIHTSNFAAYTGPTPTHVLCVYNLRELSEKFWKGNLYNYLNLNIFWPNFFTFLYIIVPRIYCHYLKNHNYFISVYGTFRVTHIFNENTLSKYLCVYSLPIFFGGNFSGKFWKENLFYCTMLSIISELFFTLVHKIVSRSYWCFKKIRNYFGSDPKTPRVTYIFDENTFSKHFQGKSFFVYPPSI